MLQPDLTKIVRRNAAAPLVCLFLFTAAFSQTGLKGRVRANSGEGIANASVTVRSDGKDLKSVNANTRGNFTIEGIAPGKYSLVVDAKGYSSGVLYNVEVKKDKVRDLGDRLILNIDRGTLVILNGSVFFREGTSVTGAKVEVEMVGSDGSAKRIANTYTNVSGEFTFRRPDEPGKYRITASYKGVSGSKDIEVVNAAVYRVAISLDLSRQDK